jgi:hypothetical protein
MVSFGFPSAYFEGFFVIPSNTDGHRGQSESRQQWRFGS